MVGWVGGFCVRGSRWIDGHLGYRNRTILVFLIYHAALADASGPVTVQSNVWLRCRLENFNHDQ